MDQEVIYRAFGQRVARRRAEMGYTQLQVANALGVSRATIANVEKGKHNLPLHQVYRLSLALGVAEVGTLLPPLPEAGAGDVVAPADLAIEITGTGESVNDAARRQIERMWGEAGVRGT